MRSLPIFIQAGAFSPCGALAAAAWQRCDSLSVFALLVGALVACSTDPGPVFDQPPRDPTTASTVSVDRFAGRPGSFHVRDGSNSLPGPGEPIDFDAAFLLHGLGPKGQHIELYDLDICSQVPAKLYTFSAGGDPVPNQLPVLASVPGDPGYNDFVRVYDVAVPPGYRANSVTSEAELLRAGFLVTATDRFINRPVVPPGSSAALRMRGGTSTLVSSWYAGQVAQAFTFEDRVTSQDIGSGGRAVNISNLYVAYNINPGEAGGGPASGVRTETGTDQSHVVAETVPGDPLYSPLWMVITYDTAAFDAVHDEDSADDAQVVAGANSPLLNAPVVDVEEIAETDAESDAGAPDASDAALSDATAELPNSGTAADAEAPR